ncbi:MAG: nucleotidyltransferase domain-containing protein [Bacillus sp. (in: Bacteria)]|nr:nucleotidyltransferase domain-containing protein [Bacillus sp. (in: firmicutes)]
MDSVSREQILYELKKIVTQSLCKEKVRIYLFGSWARRDEKQSSDIDIAIESVDKLPIEKWIELYDSVEESTIPYRVDIVNMDTANPSLVENIKREVILWKDCTIV